ncbi:uncharacterized protein EV422DRAFT_301199 [Fimicolochytrium jonesii]|uniref:uncharacterized protein n=1 Tax=Fimicolochytrium jonesii TaxID=1396493 RepID=UPI0022FEC9D2|nr:uncharacterized protein EV422DRAFT_301199 [Fimicolochytrium jonesii]KAI8823962.1 hypothetical protein EV422DRAFT_301199 [Fimicolochytrium jonesii]
MSAGGAGVARVLEKLATSVKDGNYYEAHQMYHSVCQRYLKQRKIASALQLLHQGAKNMLEHDQLGSAADLASRMLDVYDGEKLGVDDATRSRALDIFYDFPLRTEQCDQYVRNSLKWSAKFGEYPTGDPLMHHAIGSRYYKEKQYYDAEFHFLYGPSSSAAAYGHMAHDWSTEDYFPDAGYFILRAVVQYLALRKIHHAATAFEAFAKDLPADAKAQTVPFDKVAEFTVGKTPTPEVVVYKSSLVNFAQLLVLCAQMDAPAQFTVLRNEYRSVYSFDGFVVEMVEKIADVLFGLGPKRAANPFEDIMKSFFGGAPGGGAAPRAARPSIQSSIQNLDMD